MHISENKTVRGGKRILVWVDLLAYFHGEKHNIFTENVLVGLASEIGFQCKSGQDYPPSKL
jgi:predicted DsbA family dithiol-disulfide isomerase